jgi:hypothetical protein
MIYNFNLIYRRSRDGNNMIQNSRCVGKGAIFIFLFSDIYRKRHYNQYLFTTESFIFSFEMMKILKI